MVWQSGLWTQGENLGLESVVINKDVLPCRKEEINFAVCGAPLSQGKASQKLGETGTSVWNKVDTSTAHLGVCLGNEVLSAIRKENPPFPHGRAMRK